LFDFAQMVSTNEDYKFLLDLLAPSSVAHKDTPASTPTSAPSSASSGSRPSMTSGEVTVNTSRGGQADNSDEDSDDEVLMRLKNRLRKHDSLGQFLSLEERRKLRELFETFGPDDEGFVARDRVKATLRAIMLKVKDKSAKESMEVVIETLEDAEAEIDFRQFARLLGSSEYFSLLQNFS
jgi:hypothetical protein